MSSAPSNVWKTEACRPSAKSISPLRSAWTIASWLSNTRNSIRSTTGGSPQKYGLRSIVQPWPRSHSVSVNGPLATLGVFGALLISFLSLPSYPFQTCSGTM
jgi:hypothetical protein